MKMVINYSADMGKYVFCPDFAYDGDINNKDGDNYVQFNINISPSELEIKGDAQTFILTLEKEEKSLSSIRKFLEKLDECPDKELVNIESDFYWSEGDLLLRIAVDFEHPIFAKIKNELYGKDSNG